MSLKFLLPIILLGSFYFFSSYAQTSQININSPTNNQIIQSSSVGFSGNYIEVPNPEPTGTQITYQIEIQIDGSKTPVLTSWQNGLWSFSTSLSDGWHTVLVTLVDNTGSSATNSTQFLVLTHHMVITKNNLILVKLSEGCEKLIKLGNNSTCPDIRQLKAYDTSNQNMAGRFIQKSDGSWIRTNPEVKNWWDFINKTGIPIVCIECDYDYSLLDKAQLIMIEPSQFSFASLSPYQNSTISQSYFNGTIYLVRQVQDPTITYSLNITSDKYVTPDCLNANIAYSQTRLSDTISYMENGCIKTNLQLNKTLAINHIPFDLAHCTQCNYEKWLTQAKQDNKALCNTSKCQAITDPNSNPGFKFGK